MNNIDTFLNNYKQAINNMIVKQGPNNDEIYNKLCNYNSDNDDLSKSVSEIVAYIDKSIQNIIKNSLVKGNAVDLSYVNKNQGNNSKYIDVSFNKHLPSISESIQIYLSINSTNYQNVVSSIYNYLIDNKISFKSRLSKINRNDNFILALYSKEDTLKIMKYIKLNFISYLKPLNPFIYQINNIGIVKDINNIHYNKFVSIILQNYIEECILKQRENPYTTLDLQKFIANNYQESNNYKDKMMGYNLACSLYCIIKGKNILDKISDKYTIKLDLDIISKFQVKIINDEIHYYINSQKVDFKTELFLKAMDCLKHLYICRYGDNKVKNYQLNSSIVNTILDTVDKILESKKANIVINYTSKTVQQLIPYLYGYIAHKYKGINDNECLKLIKFVKDKLIFLQRIENNNYYYLINNQTFISSIPIIKNEQGFILIEYIDDDLVNIVALKNGKVTSYLNVYIDIDKVMIRNDHNYYGRLYRNAISNALLDIKRNEKVLKLRQIDFKTVFLSDKCSEVNKYVKVEMIKKIFYKKTNKV